LAALSGHVDLVQFLLQTDERVNVRNCPEAIVASCDGGHLQIVKLFVEKYQVDPSYQDQRALLSAVRHGHDDVVEFLLKDSRVDPSVQDHEALACACKRGNLKLFKLLLKHERTALVSASHPALAIAAENGHTEMVKMLLDFGRFDPKSALRFDVHRIPSEEILSLLLTKTDPYPYDVLTQMCCSLWKDRSSFLKVFLKDHRVNLGYDNQLVFRSACSKGALDIVEFLLQDSRVNPCGHRNVIDEVIRSSVDVVKFLLGHPRFDPSALDQEALAWAVTNDWNEKVELLLQDKRVDPSARQQAAVQQAAGHSDSRTLELLLRDPRVDPSVSSQQALLNAIDAENADNVRLLLQDNRVDPSGNDNKPFLDSLSSSFDVFYLCVQDPRVDSSHPNQEAIRWALTHKQALCVRCLLADQRVVIPSIDLALPKAGYQSITFVLCLLRHSFRHSILTEEKYSSYVTSYRNSLDDISFFLKHRTDCLEAVLLVSDLAQLCLEFIPDLFYLLEFSSYENTSESLPFDLATVASL
jgi:ankyrin repeat protein